MPTLFATPQRPDPAISIPDDVPVYRILSESGYFAENDTLYRTGSIIIHEGIPNEDMEPLNELASKNLMAYLDQLETSAREVAKTNGRSYAARARTKEELMDFAHQDARKLANTKHGEGMPIMGARKGKSKTRGLDEAEAVLMGSDHQKQVRVLHEAAQRK